MRNIRLTAAAPRLAALLVLAACSSSDMPPTSPELAASGQPLSVSPTSLDITWPLARPTFVASVQYATVFTATSSNTSCATVSPASALPVGPPGSPKTTTFTVTPTGEGSCTITVSDKKGNQAQVEVTVQYPSMVFTSHRTGSGVLSLYTMKADGSQVTQLTFNPERDFRAEYSRDGSHIAFTSDRDGPTPPLNFEIYSMNADGTGQTRLTSQAGFDDSPTWSQDGSKIAFASDRSGDPSPSARIWVMNADGTSPVQLTTDHGQQPAWSPDGSKIAFAASRNNTGLLIWVMDADGSNQHALTSPDTPANQGDLEPTWSPDGSKLAFTSRRNGTGGLRLFTVNADGSNLTEITHTDVLDDTPSWSPEGSGLAYSSLDEDADQEIWIVNADGSARMRITHNVGGVDTDPSWKP